MKSAKGQVANCSSGGAWRKCERGKAGKDVGTKDPVKEGSFSFSFYVLYICLTTGNLSTQRSMACTTWEGWCGCQAGPAKAQPAFNRRGRRRLAAGRAGADRQQCTSPPSRALHALLPPTSSGITTTPPPLTFSPCFFTSPSHTAPLSAIVYSIGGQQGAAKRQVAAGTGGSAAAADRPAGSMRPCSR